MNTTTTEHMTARDDRAATLISALAVGDRVRRTCENYAGAEIGTVVAVHLPADDDDVTEPWATVAYSDGEWSGTGAAWTRVAAVGDVDTIDDTVTAPLSPVDDRFDAHVSVYGGTVTRERYVTYVVWEAECTLMKLHGFGSAEHRAAHERVTALWSALMSMSPAPGPFDV